MLLSVSSDEFRAAEARMSALMIYFLAFAGDKSEIAALMPPPSLNY